MRDKTDMEMLDKFITDFTSPHGPKAVVIFIIFLGYALKMWKRFPNRCIPLVSFIVGPPLAVLLVQWPTAGRMDPGLLWPDVAAWITALIQGFLLACSAWILHAKILRQFVDDKIPALQPKPTPPAPQP